jgi:hypothetical protein
MQPNVAPNPLARDPSSSKLEEWLLAELAAVETYDLALERITHLGMRHALHEISASHSRRVESLRNRLGVRGGDQEGGSGTWGAVARVLRIDAGLLGERVAIAALEAGEERGLVFYTDEGMGACDAKTRRFVEADLLPEQQRSSGQCRALKAFVDHPS